ncbi:MAG TPA: tRNA-binding protein [Thermoanaerobaculia bacterium]|nr:tRNA-binding protein [Thermoanaerobaculia bacterium]
MKPAPIKPPVPFSALEALDVRVGTIRKVEDVPKSEKLLRLTVDFGDHERRILSGMKGERSDPQEIVGRQALFVVNLEPRKMMGELSEGMLFDLGYADGLAPALAVPEREVPNGVRAG